MKLWIATGVLAGALVIGAGAIGFGTTASAAPKAPAHVVGAWSDNLVGDTSGGWVLWSNGKVTNYMGAPNYGSATAQHLNDFVGMVGDTLGNGYWLVTSKGQIFGYGGVCEDETLVGPKAPSGEIVGAVDPKNQATEGLDLISSKGTVYAYTCQYS